MRHHNKTVKLGRKAEHRDALLANQVCSLIEHNRIKTTLAKAKAVKPLAEKMVTLGKEGTLHARRVALSVLRQKDAVQKLFKDVAARSKERRGGYTRIIKLGVRLSDAAPMAFLEWVDAPVVVDDSVIEVDTKKKAKKTKAEGAEAPAATEKPKRTRKPKAEAAAAE